MRLSWRVCICEQRLFTPLAVNQVGPPGQGQPRLRRARAAARRLGRAPNGARRDGVRGEELRRRSAQAHALTPPRCEQVRRGRAVRRPLLRRHPRALPARGRRRRGGVALSPGAVPWRRGRNTAASNPVGLQPWPPLPYPPGPDPTLPHPPAPDPTLPLPHGTRTHPPLPHGTRTRPPLPHGTRTHPPLHPRRSSAWQTRRPGARTTRS